MSTRRADCAALIEPLRESSIDLKSQNEAKTLLELVQVLPRESSDPVGEI
jgi:hypothetical protein